MRSQFVMGFVMTYTFENYDEQDSWAHLAMRRSSRKKNHIVGEVLDTEIHLLGQTVSECALLQKKLYLTGSTMSPKTFGHQGFMHSPVSDPERD